jgi:DNA-binding MarR family transcriptional regulator
MDEREDGSMPKTSKARLEPDERERKAALRAFRVVDAFREVEPRMPSSYMAAFLAVAMKPGYGPTEYAKDLGTIQPIMSRILLEIGEHPRAGSEGLGLVDRRVSSESLRNQEYYVTPKGRTLLRNIATALED